MSGFCKYLSVQIRRARKLLPALIAVTVIMFGCVGVFVALYLNSDERAEDSRRYRIALVGNTTDTYLGFGISALSQLDDSRFILDFPVMTEPEARRALIRGDITAYAVVPDDLVDAIVSGANDAPITFVGSTGQKGITGILVEELAGVASTLVIYSQNAIYAMQDILRERGMKDKVAGATDDLNLRLIDMVLNRTQICDLETLGLSSGLSTGEHLFSGLLIFFLLLMGIFSCPLFARRNGGLMRLMASKGVGAFRQVAGEYLAYLFLNLCCLLGVFLILGAVLGSDAVSSAVGAEREFSGLFAFYVQMIPVAASFAAMQFLLYELTTGVVGSVLLQFLCGIFMAYLSGCFYPSGMFPDVLRKIGGALPSGRALAYIGAQLQEEASLWAAAGLFGYLAVFFGISVFVRNCRIRRG